MATIGIGPVALKWGDIYRVIIKSQKEQKCIHLCWKKVSFTVSRMKRNEKQLFLKLFNLTHLKFKLFIFKLNNTSF